MSPRVWFLVFLSLTIVNAASIRKPPDRTLHIRSIPAVNGYNSHIYEVLMVPYNDKVIANHAVAELRGGEDGHKVGDVEIREVRGGTLQLTGTLAGLTPGEHLGISVHESGDCRQLGPIFRPDQPENSPPSPDIPAGFIGSMLVSKDGKAALSLTLNNRLALSGRRSILARGLAVYPLSGDHQKRSALACGVLGRALPTPEETAAARRRRHFQHLPSHVYTVRH